MSARSCRPESKTETWFRSAHSATLALDAASLPGPKTDFFDMAIAEGKVLRNPALLLFAPKTAAILF
jgi:hypothetical protein